MHERSVTEEGSGGWVNKVGPDVSAIGADKPGTVLTPQFDYEKSVYSSEPEASHAAERRSRDFGAAVDESNRREWMMEAAPHMRRPVPQVKH